MVARSLTTSQFALPSKDAPFATWLRGAIFTKIFSHSRGSKPCNKTIDKIIYLSKICRRLCNHISGLFILSRPFRSRWTQRRYSKSRPRSSQICLSKGPYSWVGNNCRQEVYIIVSKRRVDDASWRFIDIAPISWGYLTLSDPSQPSRSPKRRRRESTNIWTKEDMEKRKLHARITIAIKSKCKRANAL